MNSDRFKLSLLSVALLVVLRVAVGWHFFYEGMWKYKHPEFSAEGYFRNAKGPFAGSFREQIPDVDGTYRLQAAIDAEAKDDGTLDFKELFGDSLARATRTYGFTEEQQKQAQERFQIRAQQFRSYLQSDDVQLDLNELKLRGETAVRGYFEALKRLDEAAKDQKIRGTPFTQQRLWNERQELEKKVDPWLDEYARLEAALREDFSSIASPEQQQRGPVRRATTNIDWVNFLTIWTTLLVGFCLMIGLFTRLAAFVGAGFLMLVVAVMPAIPGIYPPPLPAVGHSLYVNKEVIEMLVLLFLASSPAGRWGGVDFFLHHLLFGNLFRREAPAPAPAKKSK